MTIADTKAASMPARIGRLALALLARDALFVFLFTRRAGRRLDQILLPCLPGWAYAYSALYAF